MWGLWGVRTGALAAAFVLVVLIAPGFARAQTFTCSSAAQTYVVPADVSRVTIDALGGGHEISSAFSVLPNEKLTVKAGCNGAATSVAAGDGLKMISASTSGGSVTSVRQRNDHTEGDASSSPSKTTDGHVTITPFDGPHVVLMYAGNLVVLVAGTGFDARSQFSIGTDCGLGLCLPNGLTLYECFPTSQLSESIPGLTYCGLYVNPAALAVAPTDLRIQAGEQLSPVNPSPYLAVPSWGDTYYELDPIDDEFADTRITAPTSDLRVKPGTKVPFSYVCESQQYYDQPVVEVSGPWCVGAATAPNGSGTAIATGGAFSATTPGTYTLTAMLLTDDDALDDPNPSTSRKVVVDGSAPSIAFGPVLTGDIAGGSTPKAAFTCKDPDDTVTFTDTKTCVGTLKLGTTTVTTGIAPGDTLPKLLGGKTYSMTVTTSDIAGNAATKSQTLAITGSEGSAPTVSITAPAHVPVGALRDETYSCADPDRDLATCGAVIYVPTSMLPISLKNGVPIITSLPGTYTIVATARDDEDHIVSRSLSYVVDKGPPVINVSAPGRVRMNQPFTPTFSCTDPDNDITFCAATLDGAGFASGTSERFSSGTHILHVTATDAAGSTTNDTVSIVVDASAPDIDIRVPAKGEEFALGDSIASNFECGDADGPSDVAQCSGPSTVDTSNLGTHTFTVTAVDRAGNATVSTVTYKVIPVNLGPTITVSQPANGDSFHQGAPVEAIYSCSDADGVAACSGTVPDGTDIDTSTLGPHTFRVNARDNLGNTSHVTVTYTVTP